ncbi:urease accessory protein UreD [Oricola cellulosilytica]|uniref:Urease accessory protein UreD n=1 Tax=Oricola cellulosilytica TaxID=1429082 RepID=A0A4R0PBD9_9HYPH|nr:urease accessory protein UreD [Oricola cellulosilytica]TCD13667.1 urease accessory protein UreD [Oricola cellulosilytica]
MTIAAPPPAVMQRSHGAGLIAVKSVTNRTRLDRLHQSGNAKIRIPETRTECLEAVLINTAGGITGGDTLNWTVECGMNTATVVTTQACERIYKSLGENGRQTTAITVDEGASLFWLPQETILFQGGRLQRTLEVSLADDARFLGLEAVLLGREAMGETLDDAFLHDRWRIRRAGNLLHADDLRLDLRSNNTLHDPSILAANRAFATLVWVGPEEDGEVRALRLGRVRALLAGSAGASAVGPKLLIRMAAPSGYALRRQLMPVLEHLLDGRGLPKVWRT